MATRHAFWRGEPNVCPTAAVIAIELCDHQINVNAIEPGWIDTPGERQHFNDDTMASEGRKLPWGRLGRSEEIGHAAVFLSSPESDYITGTILPVDGGYRLKHCREVPEETACDI